MRLLGED